MLGVPSECAAYFALSCVMITSLGGKNAKFFLIHCLLCGSEFGSFANGELQIVYSPFTCLIIPSNYDNYPYYLNLHKPWLMRSKG